MWGKARAFLHRLLPRRLRWYLLQRDMHKLDDPPLPPASTISWADCDEEFEAELRTAGSWRRTHGVH